MSLEKSGFARASVQNDLMIQRTGECRSWSDWLISSQPGTWASFLIFSSLCLLMFLFFPGQLLLWLIKGKVYERPGVLRSFSISVTSRQGGDTFQVSQVKWGTEFTSLIFFANAPILFSLTLASIASSLTSLSSLRTMILGFLLLTQILCPFPGTVSLSFMTFVLPLLFSRVLSQQWWETNEEWVNKSLTKAKVGQWSWAPITMLDPLKLLTHTQLSAEGKWRESWLWTCS